MFLRPNPNSGVPIYLQLMEQVKHAIETGALRPGEQLPGMRRLAEELVINPNTVAKAYRELEHEGVIDLRLPWSERRREDDHDEDPPRHGSSDRRQRARLRPARRGAGDERRDPPS